MAGGESSPLSGEQRRALLVLGYLFLRMGQFARAKKLFAALLALVLVLSLCPIALAAEAETVSIGSLHQLQAFAKRCGADTYSRD